MTLRLRLIQIPVRTRPEIDRPPKNQIILVIKPPQYPKCKGSAISLSQVTVAVSFAFWTFNTSYVIADPLHFGYWGGLITKIIWFFGGLSISGLVLTGIWISLKRKVKDRQRRKAQRLGVWKYVNGF
ncbi:MAG: PepSY-associated TM helix domain-containing protein, partial [Bacteroidota bacterium]